MSEPKEAHDIIFDGLLEASQYLCKLGSNLSLRSSNFRNDKVIKTNLSTEDDINNAVNKILLICELSKKSLDNVEKGVRKVVDDYKHRLKQSKYHEKLKEQSKNSKPTSKVNWFTFEFDNLVLRISRKIRISQYTSAQVSLKKLNQDIVNKYISQYCKIYNKDTVQTTTSCLDAPKNQIDLEHRLHKEKKQRQASSDNNQQKSNVLKDKVDITNSVEDVKNNTSQKKDNILKECKKKSNLLGTEEVVRPKSKEKLKVSEKIVKANNNNLEELEDKSSKVIKATAKEDKAKKRNQKSLSDGPEGKDRGIVKDILKVGNVVEDSKQKPSMDEKEDDATEKSLGKLSCTGGNENIRIKCVDINKLIDKAKELNCRIGFRTIKKKADIVSKIEIKKNANLPPIPSPPKESKIKFVAKPFVIKVTRMYNDLQMYKKNLNITKIVYRNKEIINLEDIANSSGEKKSLKAKNDKQKKVPDDIHPHNRRRRIANISQSSEDENKGDRANISEHTGEENEGIKRKSLSEHNEDENKGKRANISKDSEDESKGNKRKSLSEHSVDEIEGNRTNFSEHTGEEDEGIKRKSLSEHNEDENKGKRANISKDSEDESKGNKKKSLSELSVDEIEGNRTNFSEHTGEENEGIKRKSLSEQNEDENKGKRANISKDSEDESKGNKRKSLSEHSVDEIEGKRANSSEHSGEENEGYKRKNYLQHSGDERNKDNRGNISEYSGDEKKGNGPKISENITNLLQQDCSSDFELKYSVSEADMRSDNELNEADIPVKDAVNNSNSLAPMDSNSLNNDEFPNTEKGTQLVKDSSAKNVLLDHSDSDSESLALIEVKVSLVNDNSSSDETVTITQTRAKRGLRLLSASPTKRRHSMSSSSSSSSSETTTRKIKKMGRSSAKPGKNGSQGSETQDSDKDIDGLTNLNSLHRTTKRGEPDSTSKTDKIKEKGKKTQTQKKNTSVVLESDSNSSEGEQVEIDGTDFEGLPEALLQPNGNDSIATFAKSDLLGECDSTNNEETTDKEEVKMEDSSEDDNVKKKRRKLLAITSDSEADTTRKNDEDVKVSDFDDTDEENSEPAKKNKRKKKTNRSSDEASGDSSNDSSKKKRRRIKQVDDSDMSGSGSEAEGRRHGRKNIRKVMGKGQLEEATIKAAREERGRLARIAERQKLYNNLDFDESGKPDEVVLDKVVLDFDPETKEPLIQVDRGLVKKLKPHQANGIKFMWDACFESVKRIKKDKGSGCILAHCMGLGKTLQVISLTHTLLTHSELTGVRRVLVVCPLSTVLNWVSEINMWLEHSETDTEVDVYELSRYKQNVERAMQLKHWYEGGGICVLGYEMFRNLSAENSKKYRKKMLKSFQESLVDPGPDLVVCDEGHLLKNQKTSLSQSMNRIKTLRRIVLTGTPLQNNLKEYYCMVTFVKPNLLGKYNEYLNRFVNPITNGQYTDSTDHDIKIMKRRSHVLHKMLDGAVQRRDYGVLAPFLPPKHEYVVFITLSDIQITLYQHYLDNYSRRPLPGKSSGFLFPDFQSLQRIWTHPLVLKYNSERYEIMQQKKREREEEDDSEGSLIDFIDDESTPDETSSDDSSDLSDASDDSRKKAKKKKSAKKAKKESKASARRGTRANPGEVSDEVLVLPEEKYKNPTEWWIELVNEAELEDMRNSHKLVLLFDILRQCEAIGDKVLVFSQSLYSLDLIEHYLEKIDEATQEGRADEKLGGHVGSWSPGVDYFRLDGSTSCENRSLWCKNFNREDNPRARLFLISTRAGGLGINLVAANRVVIFDVSWNPSHDVQSIFRVYRFGQKKPCYVYRFLAMGTMEEKIYERQVTKQAISKRVIDEQQIDRHYAENDLAELYKFEPKPPEPRPLPPLPKDRLFAEMLKDREQQIYKYHEHDSLLENKEEETLTEEERKAAWEDFENEKNRPPPAPFPTMWPMHNGMTANLMAQQQQQLAYAAVAAVLRKDVPNINDQQIREMVPLIYNANPALMQKMGDIYKYGMMNPGMMNSVMGGGAGGAAVGLGGSSSLQYEPPWQRQQQQQQQMRLQQLMQQQQQQLGQKYYAGGLGSRDPVAMALQQQFARELGDTARGRPRGRPPLQPRAPLLPDAAAAAAAAADVVDLDSD